jgi:Mg-chelatase subunit ChlD
LGYATSIDGVNWNKYSENPVLDVGPPGSWDDSFLTIPTVLYDGLGYHIWYTGFDGSNYRIGFAYPSTCNGSKIVKYEWDFESDGIYDYQETSDYAPDGTFDGMTTHTYGDNGEYTATLKIRTKEESGEVKKDDQDVVFVIDSSSSMEWNDPGKLRIAAAKHYVNKLTHNDRAVVIDFDHKVKLIPDGWPIGDHLNSNYTKIKNNLDLIDNSGATKISPGLNLSNEEHRLYGQPANHVPITILLTDAQNNNPPSDNLLCLDEANISASRGIKIFTIGLAINSSSPEEQLLKDIANITGGKYFSTPNASHLEAIYEEISQIVENLTSKELFDTDTCNITVNNLDPVISHITSLTVDENSPITLIATATDPGSDDLTFTWDWGFGTPVVSNTLFNDGTGPDLFPSPDGISPFSASDTQSYTYGDNGVFLVTITVEDDDAGITVYKTNITVSNVNPTVTIISLTMDVEIGLRVAGRKYNNVSMTLYEDGSPLGYVSIERMPGSPDEQMAWIPVSINFSKSYNVTVTYTPEYPPNVGGNPVWIYIKSKDGSINKIHHTFNVQQSKKRDSEHWNHVEPWEVDLSGHFIGLPFEITSDVTDPGSDDEILIFTYDSQVKTVTYLNNPPNSDPYPSPEVNPVDILETTTLIYEGSGTVILVVKDDDNIGLGVGEGADSKSVG